MYLLVDCKLTRCIPPPTVSEWGDTNVYSKDKADQRGNRKGSAGDDESAQIRMISHKLSSTNTEL